MDTIISPEVKTVLTQARDKHWRFKVVGGGGMILSPKYQDGWWYLPMEKPDNIICEKYRKRIELVAQTAGIQGVIVGHEAPKLLCPPQKTWEVPRPHKIDHLKTGRIELPDFGIDLRAIGLGLLAGAKIIGMVLTGVLYILAIAASVFATVDPRLIVVTQNGTHIEVASWHE